ncbi:MAG: hypothetical protein JXB26_00045 [Candidatus Aminicenantes bacterium]|nr:hypothetical protein [Candidatus Aminicenantes bacterium]
MNHNQIQQEIFIIKKMIEKTKKETAESGLFFISLGIFAAIVTFTIGILEFFNLYHLVLPTLIIAAVVSGVVGYLTVTKKERKEKVKSYPKTILYGVLFSCGLSVLMIVFIFPLLKVYPWSLIPTLVSVIMGIAFFSVGIIFEFRHIQWCSVVWWVGAIILALTQNQLRFLIMIAIIILGWILPGFILNKQYKNQIRKNES